MSSCLQVITGTIFNADGAVLIAQRPLNKPLGGLWEFPGGKIEAGESPFQALQRELYEELDINVIAASPLMQVVHDYPSGKIMLDAWRVDEYQGEAIGKEKQVVRWVMPQQLNQFQFPEANALLVKLISEVDKL